MILANARIVSETGIIPNGSIAVDGDEIVSVSSDSVAAVDTVDLAGNWVLPGFVDIHTHGGGGGTYTTGDQTSAVRAFEFHRRAGTTTSMASMVAGPVDRLVRDIEALAELVADGLLAGIHLEGPFINVSRCGAHDPTLLRDPEPAAVDRLLRAGGGAVRMVTLAPELDGGVDAVRRLVGAGVIAAVGHTDAEYRVAKAAFDAGATVVTHLFNGMRPIDHREPGPVLAALENDDVTIELINDGSHLHPTTAKVIMRLAGPERTALVSDAISAAGMTEGTFDLGSLRVEVRDGVARIAGTDTRAGSTLTLDAALRLAVLDCGLPITDVSAALSATPARVLGLQDRIGTLAPGKQADLVVLDDALTVVGVLARGRWVTHPHGGATARVGSAERLNARMG